VWPQPRHLSLTVYNGVHNARDLLWVEDGTVGSGELRDASQCGLLDVTPSSPCNSSMLAQMLLPWKL